MDVIDIAAAAAKASKYLAGKYVQFLEVMTASVTSLGPEATPTVAIQQDGNVPNLALGIPRGKSGVYIGTTEPEETDYNVWIDPSGEADELTNAAGVSF